jgi:Helix-turn-helix domain
MASRQFATAHDAVALSADKGDALLSLIRELITQQKMQSMDIAAIRRDIERLANPILPDPTPPEPQQANALDLLTPKQAAHSVGVSDETARRWARRYNLGVTVGGTMFISRAKLEAHVARKEGCGGT